MSNNRKYDDGLVVFSKLQEVILVGLLLTAILFLFFGRSLLPGRVLSGADKALSTPFFAEVVPQGFTQPSNALLFDQVYQFTPWRHFAREALKQGDLPLWNHYSSAGTPFVATMQSAVFYPINLLLTFVPFEYSLVWSAFLRLWIAGMCTYLLIRHYGLGSVASLISATSFMLSGFLIAWLGHPHINVAIWLPALILLAEIMLRATHKGKILLVVALLALVIGIQFTGGHIETSVDMLLTFGLYYVLRWISIILPQKRPLIFKLQYLVIVPGIAVVLGTALAAVQLAPFFEWLPLSAEFHHRGSPVSGFRFIDTGFWQQLLKLPVILFPNLYNNPTWNEYPYWSFLPWGNYNENILYVGTITLLFALIGIIVRWKKKPVVKVWMIIGLISFGRAFHLPVLDWLNQLPLLNLGHPDRLRLIFSFALCILAGFGVHTLWNSDFSNPKLVEKIWIWGNMAVIAIGLIILITGNTLLPAITGQITAYGRERVDIELANRATPPQHPLEYYYAQVDEMVSGLLAAFRFDNLAMYMPVFWAFTGLTLLIWRRYGSQKVESSKVALFVLVVMDLVNFGRNYNPSIPTSHFYPITSIVQQVSSDKTLFRFTVLRQDLVPDAHMMFDFQDVRGLDFPTYWYSQYMNLVSDRIPWLSYGLIFGSVDSPLLHVLNVKYIAASQPDMLETNRNVRMLDQKGEIYLGEMIDVSPRAFMVYDTVITSNDEETAEILKNEPESVFHRVILSDIGDAPSVTTREFSDRNIVSSVDPIEYEANHSIWQIATDENGYLFLSDAYYPGWKAYLNNHPTELYRANIAFRAVFVPKGEHIVSFRYEPASVFIGAVISIVSIVIILSVLVLGYRCTRESEAKVKL